jgi:hypothetical protein
MGQLDLQFKSRKAAKLIVVTPDEIKLLEDRLRGKGWQTAAQLGAKTEQQKRKIRAVVQHSRGSILGYPGSPGYKLYADATVAEIHQSVALRVQARELLRRYLDYMRGLHNRVEHFPQDLFPQNAASTNNH